MALELRLECERCQAATPPGAVAYICSFECTYCLDCTDELEGKCPACGGELVRRPRRAESTPA